LLHGSVTAGALNVTGPSILELGVTAGSLNVTGDSLLHGSVTAGALHVTGASTFDLGITTGSLYVTGPTMLKDDLTVSAGSITFNTGTAGSILFNDVDVTPSQGDIFRERTFTAGNNILTPEPITEFYFRNDVVRCFDAVVSTAINTDNSEHNKFAYFNLKGIQKNNNWVLNSSFVGDITGVTFSINTTVDNTGNTVGQLYYTSTNITSANFNYNFVKFRAVTTSLADLEI
jgi:hypothetical protein